MKQLNTKTRQYEQAVYRWRARNHVNGLMYGNGGISSWTKTFVNNMRTHEASEGADDTDVEFCFDDLYWPMYNCYSTTYPEAVQSMLSVQVLEKVLKMCLDRGSKAKCQLSLENVYTIET